MGEREYNLEVKFETPEEKEMYHDLLKQLTRKPINDVYMGPGPKKIYAGRRRVRCPI